MAKARKPAPGDLPGQHDPAAPLDADAFLRAAQPTLRRLTEDLLARADASPRVTNALKRQHATAKQQHRTAEEFVVWRRTVVVQVAAAWLLSCVFIRVLEDRGLINARIAGPAARDSETNFSQFAPSVTHREYLLTVFRELSRLPAASDLFDSRHNLVWRLAPSDAACKDLLALFRMPSIEAPAFRFGQLDTRFLGDLYQDLDSDTREFYALLQTPDFVESFILDHTLEPAIREYGIDNADLIDPTCGSGHFLLGAFPRFLDHLRRAHPAEEDRELARLALDKIYGVDINPYAASIARFRLFLKFIEVCNYKTIRDTPKPPINVVPADSLLYGFAGGQGDLAERDEEHGSSAFGEGFNLEDAAGAREILAKHRYTAVVGNPPYITVKDAALREKYRKRYTSASGKYALSVPFMERFFALGKSEGGYIGQITSNSFMKREFGGALIEKVLRELELTYIVNTAGAYIPGHGTPTVLIFGRNRKLDPFSSRGTVLAVLAKRGDAGIPAVPAEGAVWRSIAEHGHETGFDNDYISVDNVDRVALDFHPWTLEGGGADKLKDLLEKQSVSTVSTIIESAGISCVTGEDDVYLLPPDVAARNQVGKTRPVLTGESIRDWSSSTAGLVVFPYDDHTLSLQDPQTAVQETRYLWTFRPVISRRKRFGVPMLERGLSWYELQELYREKFLTPLFISYAEVATHNHFIIDRGAHIFKQTAPIVKLPSTATEEDYLALLAYLNSSAACFWLKQVSYPKGMHNGSEANSTPFLVRFAFDSSKLRQLPLPRLASLAPHRLRLIALARAIDNAQLRRKAMNFDSVLGNSTDAAELDSAVKAALHKQAILLNRAIALQEEIDWLVYFLYGLLKEEISPGEVSYELAPGERTFEIRLAQDDPASITEGWFRWSQIAPVYTIPERLPPAVREVMQRRLAAIRASKELRMLESPVNKRRWRQPAGKAAQELETDAKVFRDQAEEWLANRVEDHVKNVGPAISTRRQLIELTQRDAQLICVLSWLDPNADPRHRLDELLDFFAVPFLAGFRYSASGREKHAIWRNTWALQRQADALDALADQAPTPENRHKAKSFRSEIPVPPKYEPDDYRGLGYFRHRGKLDVPIERFISYPGCASNVDQEPVYGWAGWDHLQRTIALFQLYYARKDDAWTPERLLPMLAGLEELLPWVRQWHADARSPETGQLYCEYFDQVIASECIELGFTRAQLETWAPPERGAAKRAAKAAKAAGAADDDTPAEPRKRKPRAAPPPPDGEPPPKRRGRPPKAASAEATSPTDAIVRKRKAKPTTPPASE